jgi:hypothetical protein
MWAAKTNFPAGDCHHISTDVHINHSVILTRGAQQNAHPRLDSTPVLRQPAREKIDLPRPELHLTISEAGGELPRSPECRVVSFCGQPPALGKFCYPMAVP